MLKQWVLPKFSAIIDRSKNTQNPLSKAEQLVSAAANESPDDSYLSPPIPYNPPLHSKFQSNTWPILLTTLPLQSVRKLYMYFPLPSVKQYKDQSPYHIISHLLGHEGPGSCFALLQNAELIDAISVGPRLEEPDHSLLQINISLTVKGEQHWEDVVSAIFEYCYLLHDSVKSAKELKTKPKMGIEKESNSDTSCPLAQIQHIWEEVSRVNSLRFHQTSPGPALSLAPSLASTVRRYGTKMSLSMGSLLNESKDTLPLNTLYEFLKLLTPQNCFIERCSQSAWEGKQKEEIQKDNTRIKLSQIFGFKKEKWYGVDYHLSPIDEEIVQKWSRRTNRNALLHLPKENPFIPTDLSLCEDLPPEATKGPRIDMPIRPPTLVINDKNFGRLWHKLDDRYCLPKASLILLLRNPASQHKWDQHKDSWLFCSNTGLHSSILIDVFHDALAQTTYDAELAGLHWSMSRSPSGIIFRCFGYSQHLTRFAIQILEHFFDKEGSFISEKHVRTNKDLMIRYYSSYLKSQRADNYASYYTNLLTSSRGFGVEESSALLEEISFNSVRKHHQTLLGLSETKAECLISGNVSKIDAEKFFLQAQKLMTGLMDKNQHIGLSYNNANKLPSWIPGPFERALREGEDVNLHFQSQNPEEQNGAVQITFQSNTPGFKGFGRDSAQMKKSIIQTAALRSLCHILREPLFNELRTKEQLGYIVNGHYDIDFSTISLTRDQALDDSITIGTTPINSIIIYILSRKVPPPILTKRIDEFLESFRERLVNLSEEEIKNYTDVLSKNLLKPIQKLNAEADDHFAKIARYSPEILDNDEVNANQSLPWHSKEDLAAAMQGLNRIQLLDAWDAVVAGKNRSRVVSHVYGSSFKLESNILLDKHGINRNIVSIDSTKKLFKQREKLSQYGSTRRYITATLPLKLQSFIKDKSKFICVSVGTGLLLYAANMVWNNREEKNSVANRKIKS
mmetsp:Transcript_13704/g.19589  ORF Transcript_13704/g.19589 Transcript_13704/m.19589 type:complete len:962 (+) Transcript_13704:2-2887(+)